jgi:GNAT superfamily N-acetyltransferase
MLIRTLSQADLRPLLTLYEHLHANDDPLPSDGTVESVWLEIMRNENIRYFGGFVDDELVASCTIALIPNLTRACRPYGVIENVVTHVNHRRRGYGTELLHAALSHAWSRNCYKVMLLTGRKDAGTLRFYQTAGFDPDGKQAFIAKPDETCH